MPGSSQNGSVQVCLAYRRPHLTCMLPRTVLAAVLRRLGASTKTILYGVGIVRAGTWCSGGTVNHIHHLFYSAVCLVDDWDYGTSAMPMKLTDHRKNASW